MLTSSDDTSVAVLERDQNNARLHFHEKVTADLTAYGGVHPVRALESHQENLAGLVDRSLSHTPSQKPDFVSVTRGPGMRSNLSTGLDFAKGLAVAWRLPLVGVHHMQAHLLTPRLVSALANNNVLKPSFPFLSILVSGGHSMLVHSTSLTNHSILASTGDIAVGDALDKAAREILPDSVLSSAKSTMYGRLLEQFAFPNGPADYESYRAPATRGEEIERARLHAPRPEWAVSTPFAESRELAFSFGHLSSLLAKLAHEKKQGGLSHDERVVLAREVMRSCFEHLASRTVIALESLSQQGTVPKTLVVSGGVAANRFLMAILRRFLETRGFGDVQIVVPPGELCTDNAAMVGWAGTEMFLAGWRSELSVRPLRRWSLEAEEGQGLLGVGGWVNN